MSDTASCTVLHPEFGVPCNLPKGHEGDHRGRRDYDEGTADVAAEEYVHWIV